MRIKIIVSYDGTNYGGWQLQKNAPSIQGELERALKTLTGSRIVIQSAGRTDAGVHALGQCAHFDYPGSVPQKSCPLYSIPCSLGIYGSFMPNRRRMPFMPAMTPRANDIYTPFTTALTPARSYITALCVPQPLDIESMRAAAQHIIGTHDFKAFCASGSYVKKHRPYRQ